MSRSSRGQALVEFAVALPLFMVILLSVLELGTAFSHHLTLEYATREGARFGAALANGGGPLGCGSGKSPNASTVDPRVIEAVQRVLTSPGSPIVLAEVSQIRIYKANSAGNESGPVNVWTYTPGAGPTPFGANEPIDFSQAGSAGWSVCSRTNANPADSIGVSLTYNYRFGSGLSNVMRFFGNSTGPTWLMTDRTIMKLNPTPQ